MSGKEPPEFNVTEGVPRRAFCAATCALMASTLLGGTPQPPDTAEKQPDPHPQKLTPVTRADLPAGTTLDFRKLGSFYLVADVQGIFALTAVCTHRGCLVLSQGAEGFGCPCHDSAYDLQGKVTEGPAKLPLRHLEVKAIEPEGRLQVDVSVTVPPETRL